MCQVSFQKLRNLVCVWIARQRELRLSILSCSHPVLLTVKLYFIFQQVTETCHPAKKGMSTNWKARIGNTSNWKADVKIPNSWLSPSLQNGQHLGAYVFSRHSNPRQTSWVYCKSHEIKFSGFYCQDSSAGDGKSSCSLHNIKGVRQRWNEVLWLHANQTSTAENNNTHRAVW